MAVGHWLLSPERQIMEGDKQNDYSMIQCIWYVVMWWIQAFWFFISCLQNSNSILMFFFAVSPPKNTPTSTLKSEVSANPLASMAISVKDLQSVQLRKTEKVGKTMSAPIAGEISSISNVVNLHGNGKTILIFVNSCLFIFTISTTYYLCILSYYIFFLHRFSFRWRR